MCATRSLKKVVFSLVSKHNLVYYSILLAPSMQGNTSPMITTTTSVLAVSDDSESEDEYMVIRPKQTMPVRVRFNNCNQEHQVPSRDSFTADEMRAQWYKKPEYEEMRQDAFTTILLHRAGCLLPGNENHSIRGLEDRSVQAGNKKRQALFKVVDEQDRQDEMGIANPNLLAEVYQTASLSSRCTAHARGLLDAQEVMLDLMSEVAGIDHSVLSQVVLLPSFDEALALSLQVHHTVNYIIDRTSGQPHDMILEESHLEHRNGLRENHVSSAMDVDWTAGGGSS